MRFCFRASLAVLLLASNVLTSDRCDEDKRIKLVKKSLKRCMSNLKDLLEEEGCSLRSSNTDDERGSVVKEASYTTATSQAKKKPTKKMPPEDNCIDFEPEKNVSGIINCFFSSTDEKNGLHVEKLMRSNLCTEIITFVRHYYYDINGKGNFTLINSTEDGLNIIKWRDQGMQVFMQMGSWGDPRQLTGQQFSKILSMPKATDRLVNATVDQLQLMKFDGVLISWYYPACFQDDCKTGPIADERYLFNFLKRIAEVTTMRSVKVKVALEISIWPESIYLGIPHLDKLAKLVDLLMFENTSPDNRVYVKESNKYTSFSKIYTSFGTLDNAVKNANLNQNRFKLITKKQKFMELETVTTYMSPNGQGWVLMNVTNKNLCLLVQNASDVAKDTSFKWPLPTANFSTDFYPYNDYDYIKAKVEQYTGPLNFDGVWIRDIWADDTTNECGCGSFPILRAANEAIGRSTCKLPNCPTKLNS